MTASAGPVRRQQARSARSRQRLKDAAASLFATHGFDAVTIDDIAAEAGISRGSVFWHFGTKEDLLLQVVDDTILEFGRRGLERAVGGQRGLAAIRAALDAHRRLLASDVVSFRLHHLQMADALGPRPELAAGLREMHRQVRALIAAWIGQAVDDGEIAPIDDPDAAAAAILGAVSGLVGHWLLDPDIDLDEAYEHLTEMVLAGLSGAARAGTRSVSGN